MMISSPGDSAGPGPANSAPKLDTTAPATAPAPERASSDATADTVSLTVTTKDKAWLRIGDRKTIARKIGDTVPGMGKIISIDNGSITTDSGQVLKVQVQP